MQREFLDKFDLLLIQAMGSSEAETSSPIRSRRAKTKSERRALAWGFETRIVNPEGADVPAGEPGEVLIRGPMP